MRLEISCEDRLGITQNVLDILVRHEIDLRGIEVDEAGKIFLHIPNIEFAEFQHLMPEIRRIKGIMDVKTTPYMPIEREKHQLVALLHSLSEPVFSIDARGRVLLVNNAVANGVELDFKSIVGRDIAEFIKGFNFSRWLEGKKITPQCTAVKFIEQDFVAELLPVQVTDKDGESNLAGAMLVLKSDAVLSPQPGVLHDSFAPLAAASQGMRKVVKEANKVAGLDAPVLFIGETGTGKELLAQACHKASSRADKPFLVLNCAALPDNVAEPELFGYAPGAYGNDNSKTGLFEQAQGGTLLLDEIGDMSAQLQAKLLRVLETGCFRRVGDSNEVRVDVRIMCTTHKDLGQLVMDGKFREDLYYRLNVLSLSLPPLRERKQDIVPLAEKFVKQHAAKLGMKAPKLSRSCVEYLQGYSWPGNVRQLQNSMFRAVSLLEGDEIHKDNVQLPSTSNDGPFVQAEITGTLDEAVKRFEKDLLRRLYPTYPSTRQLARKLGLSHTAIANKLRDYGINKRTVKL
ncbi:transcriptional regulator TyrR [Bowmanella sp. JS7-9]|uniref:HTH-type transcriptional regulatory protein TyrR n=1 Tax=Pseudobowmanella zhangzhouensis TaxID=1537679 RepID=A0ABW1XJ77_9ALTE|nr:transcriptional regulator TyrR [Bowmanella sp. JS7-9]TBX25806.1 transcriptional regulator [Bowmanella sp. JS7-9]